MKKQIVFIHGGEAFSNYAIFLEYLRTEPIEDPLGEAGSEAVAINIARGVFRNARSVYALNAQ